MTLEYMGIKFDATPEEIQTIEAIIDRALDLLKLYLSPTYTIQEAKQTLMMDVEATHSNGCPLDLTGLLEAKEIDFVHDVRGIHLYLNRQTGKLEKNFRPRYAKKEKASEESKGE